MPWMSGSLDDNPVWVRNALLAKVTTERKAEKYLFEKSQREAKRKNRR